MSGYHWREPAEPSWMIEPTSEWRPQFPGQRYPGDIGIQQVTPRHDRYRATAVGRAEVTPLVPLGPDGRYQRPPLWDDHDDHHGQGWPGRRDDPRYPDDPYARPVSGPGRPPPQDRRPVEPPADSWRTGAPGEPYRADVRRPSPGWPVDRQPPRERDRPAGWAEDRPHQDTARWAAPFRDRPHPPVSPAPGAEPGWLPEPEENWPPAAHRHDAFPAQPPYDAHRPQPPAARPPYDVRRHDRPERPVPGPPPAERPLPGHDRPDGPPARRTPTDDHHRPWSRDDGHTHPPRPRDDGHTRPPWPRDDIRAYPRQPAGPEEPPRATQWPEGRNEPAPRPRDRFAPDAETTQAWPYPARPGTTEDWSPEVEDTARIGQMPSPASEEGTGKDASPTETSAAATAPPVAGAGTGTPSGSRPGFPPVAVPPLGGLRLEFLPAPATPREPGRTGGDEPTPPPTDGPRPPAVVASSTGSVVPSDETASDRDTSEATAAQDRPDPPVAAPDTEAPSATPAGPVEPDADSDDIVDLRAAPDGPVEPDGTVDPETAPDGPAEPDGTVDPETAPDGPAGLQPDLAAPERPGPPVAEVTPLADGLTGDDAGDAPATGAGPDGSADTADPSPESGQPTSTGSDREPTPDEPPAPSDGDPVVVAAPTADADDPVDAVEQTLPVPPVSAPPAPETPLPAPSTRDAPVPAPPGADTPVPAAAVVDALAPPAPAPTPGRDEPQGADAWFRPKQPVRPAPPPPATAQPVSAPPGRPVSAPPDHPVSAPPGRPVSAPPGQSRFTPSTGRVPGGDRPVPGRDPARPDPEQWLTGLRWRLHPETLREVVDAPDALREIRRGLTEKLTSAVDNRSRARLLGLRAVTSRLLSDLDDALEDGRLALSYAEATGESRRVALVRARLARVLQWRGEHAEADRMLTEANSPELPDRLRASLHEHFARSCYEQGRLVEACQHFEQALDLRRGADRDLTARIEVALDAILAKATTAGFGPLPRAREELLGTRRPPMPSRDDERQLWGYADADGELVVPAEYAEVQPFREGVAWVRRPDVAGWELVDDTGATLIEASYLAVRSFSDGLAWVSPDGGGGWQAIDTADRVAVASRFDDVRPFRRGVATVRVDSAWGAVDRTGRMVVPPQYDGITTPLADGRYVDGFTDEGLAVVDLGGRRGVLDRSGRLVVPPEHAAVVVHPVAYLVRDEAGRWGALDRRGGPLIEPVHGSRARLVAEIDHLLADTEPLL